VGVLAWTIWKGLAKLARVNVGDAPIGVPEKLPFGGTSRRAKNFRSRTRTRLRMWASSYNTLSHGRLPESGVCPMVNFSHLSAGRTIRRFQNSTGVSIPTIGAMTDVGVQANCLCSRRHKISTVGPPHPNFSPYPIGTTGVHEQHGP